MLARYLGPVSNERTFHEMRTDAFLRRAELANCEATTAALMLTGAELAELRAIGLMGRCHRTTIDLAARLANFKLVEAGANEREWTITPWGKLVVQTAKECEQ